MNLFGMLYEWITGPKSKFVNTFADNDFLYSQAKILWEHLAGLTIFMLLLFVIIGFSVAYLYYGPYNNRPGRHYKLKYWLSFLFITFVSCCGITLFFETSLVSKHLDGSWILMIKIALANAVYASLIYIISSVIWCNCLPTNACRIFKF